MLIRLSLTLFTLVVFSLPEIGLAADIFVIANPSLSLSAGDIKDVYLGDKQIAGKTRIEAMDNAGLQDEFLDKALGMDTRKYNTIWVKKGFRDGLSPPSVKASDLEVINAVQNRPGALGYVSSRPQGVKVLAKF
jgi:hypothetical protein